MKCTLFVVLLVVISINVYGQECRGDIDERISANDFTFLSNGLVADRKTGLVWNRCSFGQTWNGVTCEGNTRGFSNVHRAITAAANSNYAGYSDWRVPTVVELETIIDASCHGPAINTQIFPNTPYYYWTSTLMSVRGDGSRYWSIDFLDGHISNSGYQPYLRLVRRDG